MQFSSRTAFEVAASAYSEALVRARAGPGFVDLTLSNPTVAGLDFPEEAILRSLADPAALRYAADPRGLHSARQAVSALYQDAYGAAVPPEQLLLTASTSEAYGYLFRLLCNPGDSVLVPSPSYPLFDLLARLHDVELIPYPLVYHDGWQIDPASLVGAITPRTRAIVAIHPNNPTGHLCSEADRQLLNSVAEKHGIPLIVDEVFLDYVVEAGAARSFAVADAPVLTFVLGGLSKMLAMPQMKLAWIAIAGPETDRKGALERLEVISDTFLSAATPPQVALPAWLRQRAAIQQALNLRIRHNLATIDSLLGGVAGAAFPGSPQSVLSRLRVEAGWSVVLRVPALESDTALAVRLLDAHSVAVHPGSFYGFPERGWLVVQLLPDTSAIVNGIRRLTTCIEDSAL